MTPERWTQIEALFHRAVECDPERRVALLDDSCSDDPELRREVEALLSCDGSAQGHVRAAVHSEFKDIGYPLTGTVISHYRILDGLGGGGMGLVYRAEDIKLGRRVAIKFLPEESAKNPAALGRFQREARSASALEHPNICPIYEFGEHEGQLFLVMQLLEGQTLRELISAAGPGKSPLPFDKFLDFAVQIADGLDAAHRKGIIHRDIKPANIFVTSQGQVKILDFGLAKLTRGTGGLYLESHEQEPVLIDPKDGQATQPPDPMLSRTGVAMGTAGYMSPEQARGENLDARTDLFSFGLVLYEMTTGQRAFHGVTAPMLRDAILERAPIPVRQLNSQVPLKLEKIIHNALEKDREARYQTAAAMRADLETVKREIGSRTLPARWVLASAAVLVVLIAGATFWVVKRRLPYAAGVPDVKFQQLTLNSSDNLVTGGAISPDGKYLAYTDANGMHIKLVESGDIQRVREPDALKSHVVWEIVPAAWFPDSKRFLVNAHPANESNDEWSSQTSSIWLVSVGGGAPLKLRDNAAAWSVSPDGSLISFGTNKGKLSERKFSFGEREIWLMDQMGEQARQLLEVGRENAICCVHFFPDGHRVSYILTDASGDTLAARDLTGGPVATLLPASEIKNMGDYSWLTNGGLLYSDRCLPLIMRPDAPCNIWTKRIDTHTGNVVEKSRRLTNWAGLWIDGLSVTANGKRVAFLESSGHNASYLADLEAGGRRLVNLRSLGFEEGQDVNDWTADSKSVLLVLERGDHYALRTQSLDSQTQETIVASAPGETELVVVSPDEKWAILQVASMPGSLTTPIQVVRVPMTGGSPELIFTMAEGKGNSIQCAKRPSRLCAVAEQTGDQKQMVITSFDPINGRGSELARLDISPEFQTHFMNLLWSISFDGTLLAMAPGPEGPIEIRSLVGAPRQVIRPKGVTKIKWLAWAADGKALFVADTRSGGIPEIIHADLHGDTTVLWKCRNDRCYAGPSPDGRYLAIDDWKLTANMWMMENF